MSMFLDKNLESLKRKKELFTKRLKESKERLNLNITSDEREEIERVIQLYRRKLTEIQEKLQELED
ncbi:MAG: hypothetical protein ACTSR8_17080 [Promethearchaeota archaeon]